MQQKKNRREIKYQLSHAEYLVIKNRLSLLLDYDRHAGEKGYFVRTIYFDDIKETAYQEKVAGVFDRRKYRIRAYNNDPSYINLECKEKYNRWVLKNVARIDENTCEALLNGDASVLEHRDEDVLKAFYSAAKEAGLTSRITVDYHREAFVYPASNLRVTFDKNLRAGGLAGFSIVAPKDKEELSIPVYLNNSVIMEIKFDDFMPEIIRSVIPHETGKPLSISKYRMCMSVAKALKA